jgi:hypothetical protein
MEIRQMPRPFRSSLCVIAVAALVAAGPVARPAAAAADAPVADAAMKSRSTDVRTLLKSGADVNAAQADGMTALHWAALNGQADIDRRCCCYAGANRVNRHDAPGRLHAAPPGQPARARRSRREAARRRRESAAVHRHRRAGAAPGGAGGAMSRR